MKIKSICGWSDAYGIDENSKLKDEILVFPNPVHNSFHFVSQFPFYENVYYSIQSTLGEKITSHQPLKNKNEVINISNLASGIYFLTVEFKNQKYFQKIIKE